MLTHDIDTGIISVRPSVSVTIRYYIETYGSPFILVFPVLKSLRNSDGVKSYEALNAGGIYKFRDFRPISGYM